MSPTTSALHCPGIALRSRASRRLWAAWAVAWLLVGLTALPAAEPQPARAEVLAVMKRATAFMTGTVSREGGYVWSYLPDFSRRWGELEARSTMIWIQSPGTATMGHLFLDAWHATGDDEFYAAAESVAEALRRAQHPAGGWNYLHDFAGEDSLREWYATVGRNAWRLEEFHHHAGNATFDDGGTAEATKFFLRLYAAKRGERHRAILDRAISFILDSQYPNGAWPQRWPAGKPDYSSFLTFNDDVAAENIDTLLQCYRVLGDERLRGAIRRAMDAYLLTLQPAPQAGWAMQYTPDLRPAAARSYEPAALATATTARNLEQLLRFHRWTGDEKFLARIPEALAWLESCRLPPALASNGLEFPTFVEVGTNRPLFLHRSGSNAANGRYWADHEAGRPLGHYGSLRQIDLAALRAAYEAARLLDPAELARQSPLTRPGGTEAPPRFHTLRDRRSSDRNDMAGAAGLPLAERVRTVLSGLNSSGYWPVPLRMTSHPYRGPAPAAVAPGDFGPSFVGDASDTSPFHDPAPVTGISVAAYIRNMGVLISWLDAESRAEPGPAGRPDPGALRFERGEAGAFAFDTGVLKGVLRQEGKSNGLVSVTAHGSVLSGGNAGLFNHYRVFTRGTRYGDGARSWPSSAELHPDGSVQVVWPEAPDRPFELRATYRLVAANAVNVTTTVHARQKLEAFEVWLASYFGPTFNDSRVWASRDPRGGTTAGFVSADPEIGDWLAFPRDERAVSVIGDGRWTLGRSPLTWTMMPAYARPLAVRRDAGTGLTGVVLARPGDCFGVFTPHRERTHMSNYLSLFGRDLAAGESATAITRLVVLSEPTEEEILRVADAFLAAPGG